MKLQSRENTFKKTEDSKNIEMSDLMWSKVLVSTQIQTNIWYCGPLRPYATWIVSKSLSQMKEVKHFDLSFMTGGWVEWRINKWISACSIYASPLAYGREILTLTETTGSWLQLIWMSFFRMVAQLKGGKSFVWGEFIVQFQLQVLVTQMFHFFFLFKSLTE